MIELKIAEEFPAFPEFHLGLLEATVANSPHNQGLWEKIETLTGELRESLDFEKIRLLPSVQATKEAYKALGKDPNRYRPSAEALLRRVVKEKHLYQISTLVDIINYLSLHSGHSIGGFDAAEIDGWVELGIGKPGEPYQAIGRGELNIENLPVYRDRTGPIGTPTSDHVRTSISLKTNKIFLVFNAFSEGAGLPGLLDTAGELLKQFAAGKNIETRFFRVLDSGA